MAELPELTILQREMNEALAGHEISLVEARQEKCLNVARDVLEKTLPGERIASVTRRGKWLYLNLEPERYLLLNLGMGADLWYYEPGAELPAKYQFRVGLETGAGFTCRFWWIGYVRLLSAAELPMHAETARLGPSPLEISAGEFAAIARRYPRGTAKSLILDQDKLSGIGNSYAHDILWEARLHPQRKLGTLTDDDLARYHRAVASVVERAIDRGGLETDFYRSGGNMGKWHELFLIGYKAGQPCPRCGSAIEAIKTGSTTTFVCPSCQAP